MPESLGTVRGQLILDVKQALNSYTQVRQQHISTVTALHTGAGAMQASGAVIAGVGLAMVAGFTTAIQAAAEFERRLDYFSAVSDSTQAEYEAISKKALQLGADTVYSANEIAESFIELGKSGINARDIINGIGEGVANLGAAADIDLTSAANIITSAVATFRLGADQAVTVADKLAGAANASIVDVEDLGVSLKYAGGVAAALGVPFEDLNTAFAILGVNGIKGSTAGTSMRQILLSLSGTTPKATNALKELGIITEDGTNRFYDAQGSAKSLAEVFEILREATAGMSDQQRTATLQQIFATRALPSLIALLKDGSAGFSEMADAINQTTALEVASKRMDNLSGDIEYLRGEIDTLMVESGENFLGFARLIVQSLESIVSALGGLPEWAQTALGSIVIIGGIVLVLVGTFGMLAGSVLNLIALGIQMQAAWGGLASIIGKVRGAIVGATAAQWGFNAAAVANPIGIAIVAIAALVAGIILLITYWEEVTAFFDNNVWAQGLAMVVFPLLGIIIQMDQFVKKFQAHKAELAAIWEGITGFFTEAINVINGVFTGIGDFVMTYLVNPIISAYDWVVTAFNNIVTGVQTFIGQFITFFQELPTRILGFFQALPGMVGYAIGFLLGAIARGILAIGAWIATNIPLIINNIVTFFQELPAKIIQFFIDLYNGAVTWVTQLGESVVTWTVGFIASMITFFQELPAKIIQFFIDLYNGAVAWFTQMGTNMVAFAINFVTGLVGFFSNLPQNIANIFVKIVDNVVRFFTQAYDNAIRIAADIFNGVRNAIAGLPDLVKGIFNNIVNAVKNAIKGAMNAVRDFASGLWEGFKDGLGIHSPSYIEEAMWQITGVVAEETRAMAKQVRQLQTLGNGISMIGNNLGFGAGLNQDLIDLYETVHAAKDLEFELFNGNAKLGVEEKATLAVGALGKALEDLKIEHNYDIDVNNPEAEPASDSIPKIIRRVKAIVGDD